MNFNIFYKLKEKTLSEEKLATCLYNNEFKKENSIDWFNFSSFMSH
jgi:hypothetical protein